MFETTFYFQIRKSRLFAYWEVISLCEQQNIFLHILVLIFVFPISIYYRYGEVESNLIYYAEQATRCLCLLMFLLDFCCQCITVLLESKV